MAQFSRTWWGQRFIAALEAFTEPGRLDRGRSYASDHRILSFEIAKGTVKARVRGNINPYFGVYKEPKYTTEVSFSRIPDTAWDTLIARIGSRADLVTRLLLNEVPEAIETVFAAQHQHLLPHSRDDIRTSCSCPDWANPCKHVAGVYYRLASQLDSDPVLLFELRGMPREQLREQLSGSPLGRILASALQQKEPPIEPDHSFFAEPVREPADTAISHREFWQGKRRIPPPPPPSGPHVSAVLIKKQGDFPAFWPKSQSFVETMEAFYERVRAKSAQMK